MCSPNYSIVFLKPQKRKPEESTFGLSRRALPTARSSTFIDLFLPWLLTVRNGRRPFLFCLLLEVYCRWCSTLFYMCQGCWRGQAYCSEDCRRLGRRRVHRKAQNRYRQTTKGKKAHRQAENRRRHGGSTRLTTGLSRKNEKKMDDPPSKELPSQVIGLLVYARFLMAYARAWFDRSRRCHFCGCKGRIVNRFPRRG